MVNNKLQVKDITFAYGKQNVLNGITFSVPKGSFLTILGPNGSGKSTLIKNIAGILSGNEDNILLDGKKLSSIDKRLRAREIAYSGQYFSQGLPLTVFDIVMLGRRPYQRFFSSKSEKDFIWSILEKFDISDLAHKIISELSGGQQQKVHIAGAIAQEADLILLDEPTSNLDIFHQIELMTILRDYISEKGVTLIAAVHDLNLACRFSDSLLLLKNGKIETEGPPHEVINAKNMGTLYNVETEIIEARGAKQVIPISCLPEKKASEK